MILIPKLKVAGSSLVARSKTVLIRRSQPPSGSKRSILFLPIAILLLTPVAPAQNANSDGPAPVSVLSFKWSKDRRSIEYADTTGPTTPAPAMIPANRNFERQRRINDPAGVRDPNADTLDGRSAELDRITQESRESKPRIDGFTYQVRIQNNSARIIKAVFWEYQFKEKANPGNLSRRQFVCRVSVKPEKTKDLEIFTLNPPTGVISVGTLVNKPSSEFDESVIINRLEYEDGSVWQRKDWNFEDVKLTAKPASEARKLSACRGL
jgi:hypothetical protein